MNLETSSLGISDLFESDSGDQNAVLYEQQATGPLAQVVIAVVDGIVMQILDLQSYETTFDAAGLPVDGVTEAGAHFPMNAMQRLVELPISSG